MSASGSVDLIHRRRAGALVAAILLGAAALRVVALSKPLYIDEIVTLTVAVQPLGRMGAVMRQIDASPALYPLLLHGWLQIARSDEWARLLSAILGTAAVAAVYLLGRTLFGTAAGAWAAVMAAIAPAQIHYAQYVRSYSLFTVLATVHVLLTARWVLSPAPRRTVLIGVTLVSAALLYTHYLAVLLFAAEGIWILAATAVGALPTELKVGPARATLGRPRVLISWIAAHAVALVLFVPGVPLLRHNMTFDRVRNEQRAEPPPLIELVPTLAAELTVGQRALGFDDPRLRRIVLTAALVAFPLVAIAGAASGWRRHRAAVLLMAAVSLLPVLVYIASGRRLIAVRFFVPFMGGYLVLIGLGLASLRLRTRVAAAALLAVLAAIPLWHFYREYEWSYDHRTVARMLGERLRPGDVLLFVHPYEALYYRWYLDDRVPMQGLVFTALQDQGTYVIKPPLLDAGRARARVIEAARHHERVWVIGQSRRSFASDPREQSKLIAWMNGAFVADSDDQLTRLPAGAPVIRVYDVPAALREAARAGSRAAPRIAS